MPVITKRQIHPQSSAPMPVNHSVPQLTVETSAASTPVSTKTEITPNTTNNVYYDDYDIPFYYNPFTSLFALLIPILLIIIAAIGIIIVLNLVFFAFMGLMLFILPKSQRCKKCGKIFRVRNANKDKCPYCGALIEEDIKAL